MSKQAIFFASRVLMIVVSTALAGCSSNQHHANSGAAGAGEAASGHRIYLPDQIAWTDSPPALPGAKMAILDGDPTKAGPFCMRFKLPDGYRVMPHWHPVTERVTVLSGTL